MNKVYLKLLLLFLTSGIAGAQDTAFQYTKGGMPFQVLGSGNVEKIIPGNIVKLQLTQKIKDSVTFSSVDKLPLYVKVQENLSTYDISEIWSSLHKGDSVYAYQLIDTFINRAPQNIPPQYQKGDKIKYYLKILEVFSNDSLASADEAASKKEILKNEINMISGYLAKNKITARKTASGAFVQVLKAGMGIPSRKGDQVYVMYKGRTFAGVEFDSNMYPDRPNHDPLQFKLGEGSMIKGFDECLTGQTKGSKLVIYIPSMLAYANNPPTELIRPFESIIFEISVLEVKPSKPAIRQPTGPAKPQISKQNLKH